jgi:hypothetical protein
MEGNEPAATGKEAASNSVRIAPRQVGMNKLAPIFGPGVLDGPSSRRGLTDVSTR